MKSLGDQWSVHIIGTDKLAGKRRLVVAGPYRYIRHPVYLGIILEQICIPLIANLYYAAAVMALFTIPFQAMKAKMEEIALLLKGAILAEEKVGLKMNVRRKDIKSILAVLPAMKKPTISNLSDPDWCDVDTIIDEKVVKYLIPKLKHAGAEGIIEYPLNKVIY